MSRRTVIRYRDLSGEPQQPPADPVEAPTKEDRSWPAGETDVTVPISEQSQGEPSQGEVSTTPNA